MFYYTKLTTTSISKIKNQIIFFRLLEFSAMPPPYWHSLVPFSRALVALCPNTPVPNLLCGAGATAYDRALWSTPAPT